jgi:hypothetical protein
LKILKGIKTNLVVGVKKRDDGVARLLKIKKATKKKAKSKKERTSDLLSLDKVHRFVS